MLKNPRINPFPIYFLSFTIQYFIITVQSDSLNLASIKNLIIIVVIIIEIQDNWLFLNFVGFIDVPLILIIRSMGFYSE